MKSKTQKVVEHIVNSYRKAGKAIGRAQRHGAEMSSWMDSDTFDSTADAIQEAYDKGEFENVDENKVSQMMDEYGAPDLYHLTATYFNKTGKILNVTD